jgi:hypothetical protein
VTTFPDAGPPATIRAWARGDWPAHRAGDGGHATVRGGGTTGNERLTAATGLVLLVLLVCEGVTIVFLGPLLPEHIFIGMLLIPPVALKLASTGYRFLRYYGGSAAYRRKGPPLLPMRILGPVVGVSTLAVLGTGVGLIAVGRAGHGTLLFAHQASFVVWLVVTGVHVIFYLPRVPRLVFADWRGRSLSRLSGTRTRRALVVAAIAAGVLLGALTLPLAHSWTGRHGDRDLERAVGLRR